MTPLPIVHPLRSRCRAGENGKRCAPFVLIEFANQLNPQLVRIRHVKVCLLTGGFVNVEDEKERLDYKIDITDAINICVKVEQQR